MTDCQQSISESNMLPKTPPPKKKKPKKQKKAYSMALISNFQFIFEHETGPVDSFQ